MSLRARARRAPAGGSVRHAAALDALLECRGEGLVRGLQLGQLSANDLGCRRAGEHLGLDELGGSIGELARRPGPRPTRRTGLDGPGTRPAGPSRTCRPRGRCPERRAPRMTPPGRPTAEDASAPHWSPHPATGQSPLLCLAFASSLEEQAVKSAGVACLSPWAPPPRWPGSGWLHPGRQARQLARRGRRRQAVRQDISRYSRVDLLCAELFFQLVSAATGGPA
jgi:hypothetical protein